MDVCKFEKAQLDELERVLSDRSAQPIAVSFSVLRHITDDFSSETEIGRGGFASVYLGTLPNGSPIAIKRILSNHTIDDKSFRSEVDIQSKAAHKNIVRLIGYCCHTEEKRFEYEGRHVWAEHRQRLICLEYVPNGSLDKYITGGLEWNQRYQIVKGICRALGYLHNQLSVFHGDLKPGNVLLDSNLVPKLFDFGLSMWLPAGDEFTPTENIMGSVGYMAPEILDGHKSLKADIYSLGVVIVEFLTGSKDYPNVEQVLKTMSEEGLVNDEALSSRENKLEQVKTCLEVAWNCMERDADKRPTAFEIIQLLDKTDNTEYYVSSGHPLPHWQSGNEELDLSDTNSIEQEQESEPVSTVEFPPSDQEPADVNTNGETNMQEDDESDLVSELPTSVDLSDLKFLEKITGGFSLKTLVGNDGASKAYPNALIYKGIISDRTMITVKRLIVVTHVKKFEREAKLLMNLNHKNIVRLLGYCHDESRQNKLVQFKGKEVRDDMGKKPEQLLCYEYMHNGSLHEYLTETQEFDWPMRYKLIKGICEGLHYLHEGVGDYPIVHLNLTPSNVFLDQDYVPHITGIDITRLIGENRANTVLFDLKGPIRYLPRDFLNDTCIDTDLAKVDIYSLGLMILEIATRHEIDEQEKLIKRIRQKWREEPQLASFHPSVEPDKLWQVKLCIDIGLDCVKPKPEQRPTAGAIINRLDKGSKPRPVVPRAPGHTNVTPAENDRTQGNEKRTGFRKIFGRK